MGEITDRFGNVVKELRADMIDKPKKTGNPFCEFGCGHKAEEESNNCGRPECMEAEAQRRIRK